MSVGFSRILMGFSNMGRVGYGSLDLHYRNIGQNGLNESNMGRPIFD